MHGFHARLWHVDTDFLCLLWSWLFFFYDADSHYESDLLTSDSCNDRVLLRTVLNESYCASAFMFLRKIEDFAVACRRPRRETTHPRSCRPPLWVVTQERGKMGGGKDLEWIPNSRMRGKKGKDFLQEVMVSCRTRRSWYRSLIPVAVKNLVLSY